MEEAFPRQWLFFEKFPANVAADPAVAIAATGSAGNEPLKVPSRPVSSSLSKAKPASKPAPHQAYLGRLSPPRKARSDKIFKEFSDLPRRGSPLEGAIWSARARPSTPRIAPPQWALNALRLSGRADGR